MDHEAIGVFQRIGQLSSAQLWPPEAGLAALSHRTRDRACTAGVSRPSVSSLQAVRSPISRLRFPRRAPCS